MEDLARILAILEELRAEARAPAWFTLKQAAAHANVSTKHLRRFVVAGMLKASNVGTPDKPLYRISRERLDSFLMERESGALQARDRRAKAYVSRHLG